MIAFFKYVYRVFFFKILEILHNICFDNICLRENHQIVKIIIETIMICVCIILKKKKGVLINPKKCSYILKVFN